MVILSADDWVRIFVLFVVYMKHPVQGTIGGWVMPCLVFNWLLLCEFHYLILPKVQIRSDEISRSVVSDSLRPHESQYARPPCPLPTPREH